LKQQHLLGSRHYVLQTPSREGLSSVWVSPYLASGRAA